MQESDPSPSFRIGSVLAEGYLAPRQSMARILSLRLDEGDRLLMIAIAIAVSCLGVAFTADRTEEIGFIIVIFGYVLTIIGGLVQYRLLSWLVGIIARAMGERVRAKIIKRSSRGGCWLRRPCRSS